MISMERKAYVMDPKLLVLEISLIFSAWAEEDKVALKRDKLSQLAKQSKSL